MHYVRAVVVLLAAMTFSLTALGQTRSAIFIFTPPSSAVVPFAGLPPCPGSYPAYYCTPTPIVRYTNTALFGTTEYTETVDPDTGLLDCQYLDYGTWTVTSIVLPQASIGPYAGKYAGVASQGTPFPGPAPTPAVGGPCTGTVGSATYMYLPIDFNWQLRRNDTAVPNYGPSATFTAAWQGERLCTSAPGCPTNFVVTVPVVRPKSETSTWVNWIFSKGQWKATLECCAPPGANGPGGDADPTFDFTGETVFEVFQNYNSTCFSSTPPGYQATVTNGPPGNYYDSVGWEPCSVEYYRCIRKPIPCGFQAQQMILIKSPADTAAGPPPSGFTAYATNFVTGWVFGGILPIRNNIYKTGFGAVTSGRTPLTTLATPMARDFPSNSAMCGASQPWANLSKC